MSQVEIPSPDSWPRSSIRAGIVGLGIFDGTARLSWVALLLVVLLWQS